MRTPGWSRAPLWTSFVLMATTGCAGASVIEPKSTPPLATTTKAAGPITPAERVASEAPPPPLIEGDDPQTISIPIEGTDYVRGRSTVKVKAPIARVRASVLDFAHYAEFMPHYRSAKLLGRTATGARDVYMEIEALHGAVTMWVEIEFQKPTTAFGVEMHESKFVKGNVEDFKAIWRLRAIDEDATELSLEVFLQPSIPLPTSLMNSENIKGSLKGVLAMRGRIQGDATTP